VLDGQEINSTSKINRHFSWLRKDNMVTGIPGHNKKRKQYKSAASTAKCSNCGMGRDEVIVMNYFSDGEILCEQCLINEQNQPAVSHNQHQRSDSIMESSG